MTQESSTIIQETVDIIPEVEKLVDDWLDIHIPLVATASTEDVKEEDVPF